MPDIQVARPLEPHTPLLPVPETDPLRFVPSASQDPALMRQEVRMSSAAASPLTYAHGPQLLLLALVLLMWRDQPRDLQQSWEGLWP